MKKDQLVEVFCFSHSQLSQVYSLYQLSLLVLVTSLFEIFLYTYTRLYRFYIKIQLIKFQNSPPNFSQVYLENSVQIQNFIMVPEHVSSSMENNQGPRTKNQVPFMTSSLLLCKDLYLLVLPSFTHFLMVKLDNNNFLIWKQQVFSAI